MAFFQLDPRVTIHQRNDGDIQLGTDPHSAIIVRGISRDSLRCFDGQHSLAEIASKAQCTTDEIDNLVAALQRAELIVETSTHNELPHLTTHERRSLLRESLALDINPRLETVVFVHGLNRLGVLISSLLRESGFPHLRFVDDRPVGHNDVQLWGFSRIDVGQRRDRTLALMHESASPGVLHKQIHPRVTVPGEFHIVVCDQQSDWAILNPNLVDEFASAGIDHVVVGYADKQSVLSPVITKETSGCLRCHFQSLVDQDSSWPRIFDNVIHQEVSDRAPIGLLIDTAIEVVQRVAQHFTGRYEDETLMRISWPERLITRDSWFAHPGCGCQWDRMD